MKALTVKVPEDLDFKLAAVARKIGESKSNLIRTAIENIVTSSSAITANSCLDLAKDLVGSVEGPTDLSHNKKHFAGYGE
jgi:predicted transcriptional regulator